jgi:hypothetical protein
VRLALISKTAQGSRVAEWELTALRDYELASLEIEAAIVDHADEVGYLIVDFMLVWETEEGRPITSPTLSWRKPADPGEPLEAGQLDGSDRSERLQDQRHKEALARMYLQTHMGQIRQYQEQVASLHEQLLRAYAQADELRDEIAEAREALSLKEEPTEAAQEPSAVQQQFLQLAAQYLPVVIAQAMKPQAVPAEQPTPEE